MPRNRLPTIDRRGDGRYRLRMQVDGVSINRTFPTELEAQQFAADYLRETAGPTRRTLADARELLLTETAAARGRKATETFYRSHFASIEAVLGGTTPLEDITTDQVRGFIAKRNGEVGIGTVLKAIQTLRRAFKLAIAAGWVTEDPTAPLQALRSQLGGRHRPKRHPHLTAAQVDRIVAEIRASDYRQAERDADVIELLWFTALRRAELARLRVRDVDLFAGTIEVDGKRADDLVYIQADLQPIIARMIADREPEALLVGTQNTISSLFQRWRKRLGIADLKPHALRHGAATHLVREGVPLPEVQRFMRHRTTSQTMRYYHDDAQTRQRTAAGLSRRRSPGPDAHDRREHGAP